jgi:(1->4)-alpha-D-glucan 1-alpha-D-glucosylmutase
MQKALREAKRTTSWVEPNERHERAVSDAIARVYERLPDGFEAFASEVAARGREVSLAQTLLKLTCPGFGDIYQGDEHESLTLVDPDNRRPVDWTPRRSAKSDLIRRVLALRSEHPLTLAVPA